MSRRKRAIATAIRTLLEEVGEEVAWKTEEIPDFEDVNEVVVHLLRSDGKYTWTGVRLLEIEDSDEEL